MSGLRDFGSTPKGKSGLIGGYCSRAASAAPSTAMVNAAGKGYG